MSWLHDEIAEQPAALRRLIDRGAAVTRTLGSDLLPRAGWMLIAARGSSDNVARYAKYVFGVRNQLSVALSAPSILTRYGAAPRLDAALIVAISQSGASPDVLAVLEEGARQGRPTIAITNEPASPLAHAADHVVHIHTGPEHSVAATKTYLNSLGVVALLSAAASGDDPPAALAEVPRPSLQPCSRPVR